VGLVIVITAAATLCLSGVFFIFMLIAAYFANRAHHQALVQNGFNITPQNAPGVAKIATICHRRLQPGAVQLFVAKGKALNAYTFGLNDPKIIVLYEPMLKVMSPDELAFVIGHEMGHVALNHTWLNTLLGGMAGIPAPFGASIILYAAFKQWNRACEYSCDRAGLLASNNLNKSIVALVKLAAPNIRTQAEFEKAFALVDAQDDTFNNRIAELFQSHPMIIRRINQLKEYANSQEYKKLQAAMNKNLYA
jgi:Zn-dependent protease with chaperone function